MKTKVFVEFHGRKYLLNKGCGESNNNCSLFVKGVCDLVNVGCGRKLPCDDIVSAMHEATGDWFNGGFKEV